MPMTTRYFWDCNCLDNFIHPKTQKDCPDCAAAQEDQPDARVSEVVQMLLRQGGKGDA